MICFLPQSALLTRQVSWLALSKLTVLQALTTWFDVSDCLRCLALASGVGVEVGVEVGVGGRYAAYD